MNIVYGIVLAIVALTGIYYMNQAGFFEPITGIVGSINEGFRLSYGGEERSDFYHAIRIRFVALGPEEKDSKGAGDMLALVAHPKNGGIDVTGWTLRTDKGTFKIPPVYNAYSPSTKDAAPEDIFLRDGDRITFYGGVSPNGRNERVTQSEYRIWLGDFLKGPHGKATLRDADKVMVDEYEY